MGRSAELKETVIGIGVYERVPGYDPKIDPIVRVDARRLRAKLQQYYDGSGRHDEVRIELPVGSYVPVFRLRAPLPEPPVTLPVGARIEPELVIEPPKAPSPPPPPPTLEKAPRRSRWIALVASAVVLAVVGSEFVRRSHHTSDLSGALRVRPFTTMAGSQSQPSFSPDGSTLAFTWDGGIFLQRVDSDQYTRLTRDAADPLRPLWSPDGKRIAFLRRDSPDGRVGLYFVDLVGGEPRHWIDLLGPEPWMDWSPDGRTIAVVDKESGGSPAAIFAIDVETARRRRLTTPPRSSPGDDEPAYSPDGRVLAFRRHEAVGVEDIYLLDLQDSQLHRLTWLKAQLRGFTWAAAGDSLIFSSRHNGFLDALWRVPASGGQPSRIDIVPVPAIFPVAARSGDRLAYLSASSDENIWRVNLNSNGAPERCIDSTFQDSCPRISPDGARIAFRSDRSGHSEIWTAAASGQEQRRLTYLNSPQTGAAAWSPDGRQIAFESGAGDHTGIYLVPAQGGPTRRATTPASGSEAAPAWSRDGQWLYFASDRTGDWQIWRMSTQGGDPLPVTRSGGFRAVESGDGHWLIYNKAPSEAGLWRIPMGGGVEEPLAPALPAGMQGNWALNLSKILYLERLPGRGGLALQWFDIDTSGHGTLRVLPDKPAGCCGIDVSLDGSWLLYSQVDTQTSNIYLLENFR